MDQLDKIFKYVEAYLWNSTIQKNLLRHNGCKALQVAF